MVAADDKTAPFHAVFLDMVMVQRPEVHATVRKKLALHDFHDLPLFVFKLFCEYDNGKRFRYERHECFILDVIFSLTEGTHSSIGRFTAVTVYRGQYGMSHPRRFLRRIRFIAAHFPDTDNLRVKTQRHIQQGILSDVLLLIFGRPCQRMDNAVTDRPIMLPYKIQLPASVLYRKDTLAVGNRPKSQPVIVVFPELVAPATQMLMP